MCQGRKPSRYIIPSGSEAEFEPGSRTRVLRNRLGICRKIEMDLMAFQAAPDYGFWGRGAKKRRAAYLDAVRKSYVQDYDRLTAFFVEALDRRLRKG